MKERKIYFRIKKRRLVCEGKSKKKTIFLFSIPCSLDILNSDFFTREKKDKIMEKIKNLDIVSAEKKSNLN